MYPYKRDSGDSCRKHTIMLTMQECMMVRREFVTSCTPVLTRRSHFLILHSLGLFYGRAGGFNSISTTKEPHKQLHSINWQQNIALNYNCEP